MKKTNNKERSFVSESTYKVVNLKPKGLTFAKLYFSRNIPLKYLLAALAGVLFAVLSLFLLKNTGGFSYGLGGLLQGVSRLISYLVYRSGSVSQANAKLIYSILFWGLLLVCNIPLFIFSWKKIGHRFTLLSLTFIVVDVAVGLGLDQIPNINNIYILGDTSLYVTNGYNPDWINQMKALGVQIIPFSVPNELVATYHPSNYIKPFLLLISGIVYALIAGIVFAMLYIVGGCTTGTDFISTYLSTKKNKDVAVLFFIINLCTITLGVILGCFIPTCLISSQCATIEFFFSANYVSTIVSLLIFTFMFKKFYPRNVKYKVEVFSHKTNDIRNYLYKNKYVHASSIDVVKGGYSSKKQTRFMTICSTMELPLLLDEINSVDNDSIITVTKLVQFKGSFAVSQLGSDGEKA